MNGVEDSLSPLCSTSALFILLCSPASGIYLDNSAGAEVDIMDFDTYFPVPWLLSSLLPLTHLSWFYALVLT